MSSPDKTDNKKSVNSNEIQLPPPKVSTDKEKWINDTIRALGISNNPKKNKDIWRVKLSIDNFPPDCIEFYEELQNKIATMIPLEQDRPTISLKIRGSAQQNKPAEYACLGGVGILSDAAAIVGTVHKIPKDQRKYCSIDLLSAPPPRKARKTFLEQMKMYCNNLREFANNTGAKHFSVLSNTAHSNKNMIMRIMGIKKAQFVDLTDKVVQAVSASRQITADMSKNVLVLGTIVAYNNDLYPVKLRKEGVATPHTPTNSGALVMQALIDSVKSGKTHETYVPIKHNKEAEAIASPEKTNGEAMVDFILEQIDVGLKSGHDYTQVVLGCTEIGLCLSTKQPNSDQTYRDMFDKKFVEKFKNKRKPHLVDTEDVMSQNVSAKMNENVKLKLTSQAIETSSHLVDLQKNVLVIGSLDNFTSKLYPRMLKNNETCKVRTPNKKGAQVMQALINSIKCGEINEKYAPLKRNRIALDLADYNGKKTNGEAMVDLILSHIGMGLKGKQEYSHIVFDTPEISQCLATKLPRSDKTYGDLLNKRFNERFPGAKAPVYIDPEHLLSQEVPKSTLESTATHSTSQSESHDRASGKRPERPPLSKAKKSLSAKEIDRFADEEINIIADEDQKIENLEKEEMKFLIGEVQEAVRNLSRKP